MEGEGYGGGVWSISTMKAVVRGVAWKDVAMMSVKRATLVMRFMVGEEILSGTARAESVVASVLRRGVEEVLLLDIGPTGDLAG